MNKKLISLMAAVLALLSASGQVAFTGVGEHPVIEVTPEMSTGLDKIYVVYDTQGVSMTFNSSTGEPATWESFYYRDGGLVMEPVSDIRWNGMATKLDNITPNIGYKIQDGNNHPYYCWVVNYADYYMELNDIFFIDDSPCSLLSFNVDGTAPKILYCTVNGRIEVLDREIELSYNTLEWNDTTHWQEKPVVEKFESLDDGIEIEPPLCNTVFRLSGDRFLKQWDRHDLYQTIESSNDYTTKAVRCKTTAFFLEEDGSIMLDEEGKEMKLEGELTDGSAPVRIMFTGYPTDAAVYYKWEIANDVDFEDVILQYNQNEVDYTFHDAGTYYMRYMVANAAGSCESYGDTYTINVSESQLGKGARGDIPNVFSPDINEVWKVPHKSIVEFHCWIYNRWGALLYEFTDPNGGWDGRYKGRLVDTGVYYYVVTATGSDGVKYKKRGDINILRYKGSDRTSADTPGSGI